MDRLRAYLDELLPKTQPAFRPTAIQGLLQPRPEAEIKTPESFVRSGFLGENNIGRQLGLLGLGFAPGAGFSDYAGTFPSAQGGVEPGFQQNIQQGNYLTAGLQGLGALGDAATATGAALGPLGLAAGAGVGSIAKAPRAVQRGVKGLIDAATPAPKSVMPQVDELGFYSAVEKAVLDNPQQKGTGQQFLAQLQKTPGVKPEELQYTGLDQFLANRPNVTKTEIQDFLDTNRVQVQEVTLGSPDALEASHQAIANRYGLEANVDVNGVAFYDPNLEDFVEFRNLPAAMRADLEANQFAGMSRWHLGSRPGIQTEIPGGENYREVLLTLPTKARTPKGSVVRDNADPEYPFAVVVDGQTVNRLRSNERAEEYIQEAVEEVKNSRRYQDAFRSSHFDQPNVLAHMRVNDRTVDGKRTMFIEEVQSDWHQTGRKGGYKRKTDLTSEEIDLRFVEPNIPEGADPSVYSGYYEAFDKQTGKFLGRHSGTLTREQAMRDSVMSANQFQKGVPDAPFKTSWHELTLKKAINEAATKGYDQIAFTTGATQAQRYDLSKQVGRLVYNERTQRLQAMSPDMKSTLVDRQVSPNDLPDVVGKEASEKLLKSPVNGPVEGIYQLDSKDMVIGGEGMKGFYDKILPKSLEKLGKKYNVKPVLTEMDTPDGKVQVWKFPVPKEMAETVKSQGQPLFQIGAGAAGLGTAGLLATEEELF